MRVLSVLSLFVATSVAQTEAAESAAGPAIAYENAFPAQAGFDRPLFVAFDASDAAHAYIVTQPGHVFAVPRDGTKAERHTFLDMSAEVYLDNWEEGLLGFAFDPDYAKNGFVYAYWSERTDVREAVMADGRKVKSNRQSVISRFGTKEEGGRRTADLATELRVMEIYQPFGNHNGGTILFGPDGMLYVALGDGGAAQDPFGNGQSKATLLGKVLRIDVRSATKEKPYAIPADNPFVAEQGARGEIWCYGMRNPWRLAFDRATGELWCADVGQDRIEEVDRLVKGGNYGWNVMEGTEVFKGRRRKTPAPPDLIGPVVEYTHSEGVSITGGHVYRGKRLSALEGHYIYGDFMTLRMWAVKPNKDAAPTVLTLTRVPGQVSSFAEEPDGEILVTTFGGKNGVVYRMVPGKAD